MKRWLSLVSEKKSWLDNYRPFPEAVVKNLENWFRVELTYTSNAIEGNTLSRRETALVLDDGLTVEGKTLNEHLEAVNHAQALDFIQTLVVKKRWEITQNDILEIHRIILQKIDDTNAGRYRTVAVRIAGSRVTMPNAAKVPQLMSEFISWLQQKPGDELKIAMDAHYKLVSIHPFVDGNGRVARILMNLLLIQSGYPPVFIKKEERHTYLSCIEAGQLGKSMGDYYQLMYKVLDRSLDIYLAAVLDENQKKSLVAKNLLKIGELAKLVNETVPTIRHWTKEGLLIVSARSEGGYQLYEKKMIGVVKKIRKLQREKRRSISEIKKLL